MRLITDHLRVLLAQAVPSGTRSDSPATTSESGLDRAAQEIAFTLGDGHRKKIRGQQAVT